MYNLSLLQKRLKWRNVGLNVIHYFWINVQTVQESGCRCQNAIFVFDGRAFVYLVLKYDVAKRIKNSQVVNSHNCMKT